MKDIGNYIVYIDGRVYNKKRNRYMTISKSKKYVTVYIDGVNKNLHRLLAELFIPNPDNKPMVLHKDDDGYNYNIDNLYWGDMRQNVDDMRKNGNFNRNKGEKCHNSKLKDSDVSFIRSSSLTNVELARLFSVSPQHIGRIKKGEKWRHIKTQTGK